MLYNWVRVDLLKTNASRFYCFHYSVKKVASLVFMTCYTNTLNSKFKDSHPINQNKT